MKIFFMILNFLLIENTTASALNFYQLVEHLENLKNSNVVSEQDVIRLDQLIVKTSPDILEIYPDELLKKIPSDFAYLSLYKRSFRTGIPVKKLGKLASSGAMGLAQAEVEMLGSTLAMQKKDYYPAVRDLYECVDEAEKVMNSHKSMRVRNHHKQIKNMCLLNLARIRFESREYKEGIADLEKIDKRDLRWPLTITEKAWAYYKMNDFNRAIGLTITLKSPLFNKFNHPEADYLRALSYYRLCLYQDANFVITDFVKRMKSVSETELMNTDQIHPWIEFRLRQRPHAQKAREIISDIKKELDSMVGNEAEKIINRLRAILGYYEEKLKRIIKEEAQDFVTEYHMIHNYLMDLQLQVLAKERDLLYENKKLLADRARGSFDHVKKGPREYFYKFTGEFWADELGDYSFGLLSNCREDKAETGSAQ